MARPGVTYSAVSKIAQQLAATGKVPTIESIRITLGTGSNSTLGAHLRTWKAKQDQSQQIATKENIPEALIAALKGVWDLVMSQSDNKIQSIQQEAQQELVPVKQENQRLQQDNARLQQQYHQVKQERDGFAHEKSVVEQLLANAKIEIVTLSEKLIGAEQQNQEKRARIDELHRQSQQTQANLEHYRNASLEQRLADQQRYEQQQKQHEYTIQQLTQELTITKQEKTALQQENQQLVFEHNNFKTQFEKLSTQHELTTIRLTNALSELAKLTQDQQHSKSQFDALQLRWDEQNKLFVELQTKNAILATQSKTVMTDIKEIREQNKVLAHEKWMLGQEKAQLYGQLKQLEPYSR